jgi:succinoglycan biosynthesis protein ExoO
MAIKARRSFPLVLDSVDALYVAEKRFLLQNGASTKEIESYLESLRQEEARRLAACNLVVTVTDTDKAHLEAICPLVPYETLPIEVSYPEYVEPSSTKDKAPELIFLGYSNFGNMDGIRWFVKECWPGVLNKFPQARLKITGNLRFHVRELGEYPGVELTGFVPDLEALYRSATLVIAPVTAGSGVKVKVLEAMAYGRAAVVSTIAAEGLEEAASTGAIIVAKNRAEFIGEVCRLIEDGPARHEVESRGRLWMKRCYQPAIAAAYTRIFKHLGYN